MLRGGLAALISAAGAAGVAAQEQTLPAGPSPSSVWGGPGAESGVSWAVVIAGSLATVVSVAVLVLGLLELAGSLQKGWRCSSCCASFFWPNLTAGVLWLPIVGLATYLLAVHVKSVGVVFVAVGSLCVLLHAALLVAHACRPRMLGTDHPKQQLLTTQDFKRHGLGAGNSSAAGGGSSSASAAAGGETSAPPACENPFRATYGLLPGTSASYGYTIFIPGSSTGMDPPERTGVVAPYGGLPNYYSQGASSTRQ